MSEIYICKKTKKLKNKDTGCFEYRDGFCSNDKEKCCVERYISESNHAAALRQAKIDVYDEITERLCKSCKKLKEYLCGNTKKYCHSWIVIQTARAEAAKDSSAAPSAVKGDAE